MGPDLRPSSEPRRREVSRPDVIMKPRGGVSFSAVSSLEMESSAGLRDRWLSLAQLAEFLGLTERSVLRLGRQGLPLRRVTPRATPGVLESELLAWIRKRPKLGLPVQPAK